MSGFGHRVYKNYDPRAKVIRKLAEEVFAIVGRDPLIEVLRILVSFASCPPPPQSSSLSVLLTRRLSVGREFSMTQIVHVE